MLLFKKAFWDPIVRGDVTLTFRRWQRPQVKVGGRYRCHPIGVLQVDALDVTTVGAITSDEALRAGFPSREALLAYVGELGPVEADTPVYRVAFHHGGDGDRVDLALEDALTPDDVAAIRARLAKLDGEQPWTLQTMRLIAERPRVAASALAAELGRERLPFKEDVRKLKKLGLTQSFEVGYEVSPRGRAFLAAIGAG